jgi:gentisate 1,2-dioxygenase
MDLPADYLQDLRAQNTLPLRPSLRAVLPYGGPRRSTHPVTGATRTSDRNFGAPAS